MDLGKCFGRLAWTMTYLCQRMPYSAVSVVTLTSLARINRSRFYQLYQSKEGLVNSILDHDLKEASQGTHEPALFLSRLLKKMHLRSALYRTILCEAETRGEREIAAKFLEKLLDCLAEDQLDCSVRRRSMLSGLGGLLAGWLESDKHPDKDALSEWFVEMSQLSVRTERDSTPTVASSSIEKNLAQGLTAVVGAR
ncbi:hypothetical protein [Streptomyces sp. NPDC059452]|uniref:hypothetical protein n=1 Tax=Streptomyces sp. NPDC059452 TaxID=3346835 RepID=UPI0036C95DB3